MGHSKKKPAAVNCDPLPCNIVAPAKPLAGSSVQSPLRNLLHKEEIRLRNLVRSSDVFHWQLRYVAAKHRVLRVFRETIPELPRPGRNNGQKLAARATREPTSVSTTPGLTMLTRKGESSMARARVRASTAPSAPTIRDNAGLGVNKAVPVCGVQIG